MKQVNIEGKDPIFYESKQQAQTAVEWLHEKLAQSSQEELVGNINLWFKQAKEMEKQQIETAYNKAVPFKYGKEYYNETFKK